MLTEKFRNLRLNEASDFKLIVNVPEGFGELAAELKTEIEKLGCGVTILESNDPSKFYFTSELYLFGEFILDFRFDKIRSKNI